MVPRMKIVKRLSDEYRFPGFLPEVTLKGLFGDPCARIITLIRRQKKHAVAIVAEFIRATTTRRYDWCGTCPVAKSGSIWKWKREEYFVKRVGP